MVDIHSHILWGLDDGAKTLADSVAMAELAAATGTTDIVATPHANNRYLFDSALIEQRVQELRRACNNKPRIHSGADFHLSFGNLESALRDPRPYTVNHARYLMVELPELVIPPDLGQIFERLQQVGILPVITHPERNRALWRDEKLFSSWLQAGCYAQITAQSLEGHFGRTARDVAWRLLDEEQAHFVASDGHDLEHRPPRLDRAYAAVAKKYDEETARRLFVENPRDVLDGVPIQNISPARKQKPRFWLFR